MYATHLFVFWTSNRNENCSVSRRHPCDAPPHWAANRELLIKIAFFFVEWIYPTKRDSSGFDGILNEHTSQWANTIDTNFGHWIPMFWCWLKNSRHQWTCEIGNAWIRSYSHTHTQYTLPLGILADSIASVQSIQSIRFTFIVVCDTKFFRHRIYTSRTKRR